MVKLIFFCRRRPEISRTRYAELVLDGHVPLALRHHPTMLAYAVNIVEVVPQGFDELDGVAELSFDTLEDYRERLYDSPVGRAAIERDVAGFMAGADGYVTTEHVQKAPGTPGALGERSPGVKLLCPVRRVPALSHEAFVEHWLTRHVPLALRHHPGLSKYVTNVVDQRLDGQSEAWDGIAELHFASTEAMATGMFDSPEGEVVIREDVARFIGRTGAYVVGEYPQKRSV